MKNHSVSFCGQIHDSKDSWDSVATAATANDFVEIRREMKWGCENDNIGRETV